MAFQDILAAIDIVTGPDPAHSILAFSIVVGLFLLWLRKQALARFYKVRSSRQLFLVCAAAR